jgi:enoyl-CoA hydratase
MGEVMDYQNIVVEKKDKIALLTISREKALNALNDETIAEIQDFFDSIGDSDDVNCIVITGQGKAFVAGADIAELAGCNVEGGTEKAVIGHKMMRTIENCPWPVIAAVNGFALGGGCELALACDFRLASEKAKFGQPEVNLGIIPGYGGTQRLPRLIGAGKAKELVYTGNIINAEEAYRIGLADEIYPLEELMDKAMDMAKLIVSKGPLAIKAAKKCINEGLEGTLKEGCELESQAFGELYGSEDTPEGLNAFLEKRPPQFKGK